MQSPLLDETRDLLLQVEDGPLLDFSLSAFLVEVIHLFDHVVYIRIIFLLGLILLIIGMAALLVQPSLLYIGMLEFRMQFGWTAFALNNCLLH